MTSFLYVLLRLSIVTSSKEIPKMWAASANFIDFSMLSD